MKWGAAAHLQKRGFAATDEANDNNELARLDGEIADAQAEQASSLSVSGSPRVHCSLNANELLARSTRLCRTRGQVAGQAAVAHALPVALKSVGRATERLQLHGGQVHLHAFQRHPCLYQAIEHPWKCVERAWAKGCQGMGTCGVWTGKRRHREASDKQQVVPMRMLNRAMLVKTTAAVS